MFHFSTGKAAMLKESLTGIAKGANVFYKQQNSCFLCQLQNMDLSALSNGTMNYKPALGIRIPIANRRGVA
jgi:hypothetical protein